MKQTARRRRKSGKIDWGDEDFSGTYEEIARRNGCSSNTVLNECRRRGIRKIRGQTVARAEATEAEAAQVVAVIEAQPPVRVRLECAEDAARLAELTGCRVRVEQMFEPQVATKPQAPREQHEQGVRIDVNFGDCWRKHKSFGGCRNKTPILASGKTATVCHVHAAQATKDRWKYLERCHKQSTVFPLPGLTVDSIGTSPTSKKYGWGEGQAPRDPEAGGNHWPHGRPPKSIYGKKKPLPGAEIFPAKTTGNISGDSTSEHRDLKPDKMPKVSEQTHPARDASAPRAAEQAYSAQSASAPRAAEQMSPVISPLQVRPTLASDIKPAEVEWFWRHRIPAGMLTVLYAPPGVGKSTLTAMLAAVVSTGGVLPEDDCPRKAANAIFAIAEDQASTALIPRLVAAGADCARVPIFGMELQLRLPEHIPAIEVAAAGAKLIVVDPLRAFVNGDSRPKVREMLVALEGLAGRTGAAVLVVHHSPKANEASPMGSQDIVGIPRSLLRVEEGPDGVRSIIQAKKNLAPDASPICFRVVDRGGIGVVQWVVAKLPEPEPPKKKKSKAKLEIVLGAVNESPAIQEALMQPAVMQPENEAAGSVQESDHTHKNAVQLQSIHTQDAEEQDSSTVAQGELEGDLGGTVSFSEKSHNRKLSPVSVVDKGVRKDGLRYQATALGPFCSSTFVSIQATCPDSCAFKRRSGEPNGCFADAGFSRMLSKKLDLRSRVSGVDAEQTVRDEVRAIDGSFRSARVPQDGARGGRDLRLHVGGDAREPKFAELLAGAADRWRRRGGGAVWTYTHAWREVPRSAWGKPVSVLASIEHPEDAARARAQGYQPAIAVDVFPNGPRVFEEAGQKYVPCPAEISSKLTCVKCRLCLNDGVLENRELGIAFALHGQHHNEARAQLVKIRTPGAEAPVWQPQKFKCGNCGEPGHKRQTCSKQNSEEQSTTPADDAADAPSVDRVQRPRFAKSRLTEAQREALPRCPCCDRIAPGAGSKCSECMFCKDVDGKFESVGMCPKVRAKTLRPVTPEQVEREMQERAARKKPADYDPTRPSVVVVVRPKYEPF